MTQQAIIKIYGLVQGVNFRYYVLRQAELLNLKGYVKNNQDGTVEIATEGKESDIKKLIELVKSGSPSALVENVEVNWKDASGKFSEFEIQY